MRGNNAMGILFAYVNEERVSQLTKNRVMASVPFGGRYRLVDFPLSNMVNSGINKVGVITEPNYLSLMDHLGSGKAWDLSRKREGLYLLPPFGTSHRGSDGKIGSLNSINRFIKDSREDYVILSDCDIVCNINYKEALSFHIENSADVTVVYYHGSAPDGIDSSVYTIDPDNRARTLKIKNEEVENCDIGMGMYIINRKLLLEVINDVMGENEVDFDRSIIYKCMEQYKVFAYEFKGQRYQISSMEAFFNANMALMNPKIRTELFDPQYPIYTKVRDDMPVKYGFEAKAENSLIADGCTIDGEVYNCVLFRGVKVEKGAVVKNCVIMQDTVIEKDAKLEYTVTDKDVTIVKERVLTGSPTYPIYVSKGSVV